jgi:hypothetical protein
VYVISSPGSYYLTGNITTPGKNAIRVTVDDVTIDLNGFSVTSTANPPNDNGIIFQGVQVGSIRNGVVRNGRLKGWLAAVEASGTSMHVTDVSVSECVQGIDLGAFSNGSLVDHCTVYLTTGTSILAETVSDCSVSAAANYGIEAVTVENCVADCTGPAAISAANVTNCYGRNAGTSSTSSGINAENVANSYGEGETGIKTTGASALVSSSTHAGTANNCTGRGRGGNGIDTDVATGSRGETDSGTGLFANYMATNCLGISKSGEGLVTSIATNCFAQTTSGDVALNANGTATGCRGWNQTAANQAISTAIAIGCTSAGGSITATGGKFLGTP